MHGPHDCVVCSGSTSRRSSSRHCPASAGDRQENRSLPAAAGPLHGPNPPSAGHLSKSHKQQLAGADFLGSIPSFQQRRRIQRCRSSLLVPRPFSPAWPEELQNPGHAIPQAQAGNTHCPTCASPRLPETHAYRSAEPPAKRTNFGQKQVRENRSKEAPPATAPPITVSPPASANLLLPSPPEHSHIQPFQLAHVHPSLPRSPEKLLHPLMRAHQD